ncbi:hypothetical protein K438DRAFT_1803467 [Mycena galopus ATCC 62051]|nr:hypothetical protein K438DRAFT_1803467 [Mycena galopus ATCC 62051]
MTWPSALVVYVSVRVQEAIPWTRLPTDAYINNSNLCFCTPAYQTRRCAWSHNVLLGSPAVNLFPDGHCTTSWASCQRCSRNVILRDASAFFFWRRS